MRIGYLIIRENLDSPVIQSQVLDVLKEISRRSTYSIDLIWYYRFDYFFKRKKFTSSLKKELRYLDINLIQIPFLGGRFPVPWWALPFMLIQWVPVLVSVVLIRKIDLLHCRSYHAGLSGVIAGSLLGMKIVFDARSPFTDEKVAAGFWKEESINDRTWRLLESFIFRKSSISVFTSNSFLKKISDFTDIKDHKVIPNNVSWVSNLNDKINDPFEKNVEGIMLSYVGSLGHWNKSELYLDFFNKISSYYHKKIWIRFVLLESSADKLKEVIDNQNYDDSRVEILTVPRYQVPDTIKPSVAGLQLMDVEDVRLSIKVVEYLASGVPVIVSSKVLGAAQLIFDHDVGYVVDLENININGVINFLEDVQRNRLLWRQKCHQLAMEHFSTESVARQYLKLYKRL